MTGRRRSGPRSAGGSQSCPSCHRGSRDSRTKSCVSHHWHARSTPTHSRLGPSYHTGLSFQRCSLWPEPRQHYRKPHCPHWSCWIEQSLGKHHKIIDAINRERIKAPIILEYYCFASTAFRASRLCGVTKLSLLRSTFETPSESNSGFTNQKYSSSSPAAVRVPLAARTHWSKS